MVMTTILEEDLKKKNQNSHLNIHIRDGILQKHEFYYKHFVKYGELL